MKICFPHPPGSGGPGSFQIRIEQELKNKGWEVCYAGNHAEADLVFVVGGTKRLIWLWNMKRKKIPIVYRLDGISWLHKKKKVGLKNYLLSEFRNWSSKFIHAFLADKIVYQSKFVEKWWSKCGWRNRKNTFIIYNGVDLPDKLMNLNPPTYNKRLVILEGTIDYTPYAVELINELAETLSNDIRIELYGKFEYPSNEDKIHNRVVYAGFLNRNKVFDVLRGSVYLSLDLNPACPNTVIEAMACGAPVVAFDTGALPELVENGAGEIISYGSDPWKLGYPDSIELMKRIELLFDQYQNYSKNAYELAIENFGLERMVNSYLEEIQTLIS